MASRQPGGQSTGPGHRGSILGSATELLYDLGQVTALFCASVSPTGDTDTDLLCKVLVVTGITAVTGSRRWDFPGPAFISMGHPREVCSPSNDLLHHILQSWKFLVNAPFHCRNVVTKIAPLYIRPEKLEPLGLWGSGDKLLPRTQKPATRDFKHLIRVLFCKTRPAPDLRGRQCPGQSPGSMSGFWGALPGAPTDGQGTGSDTDSQGDPDGDAWPVPGPPS